MSPAIGDDLPDGAVRDKYRPDQDRSLSLAVLRAIERYKDESVSRSEFVLYDNIDPDALDNLFRDESEANTVLMFDTDSVRVQLWGDGGVVIEVIEQPPTP